MAKTINTKSKDIGSAWSLLGKSYEIVKKNWQMFVFVNLFTILFSLSDLFTKDPKNTSPGAKPQWVTDLQNMDSGQLLALGAIGLVILGLCAFFYAMMVSLELKATKGKSPGVNELAADGKKYFLPLLGQLILTLIIVTIGFILLIAPGIFAIMRLIMAPYVLVNENVGVIESLKRSNKLAKANANKVWAVLGVALVVGIGTAILSTITFVGAIAALVLSIVWSVIFALRYVQLKGAAA